MTPDEFARQAPDLLDDLRRFARSLTSDGAAADDLVQDTFERALTRVEQFRGDSSLRTWLHSILHHLAVDRARRSARELAVDEVEDRWRDDSYTVDPAVVVARLADRDEIDDALLRLPFHYRSAVVLHDMVGWTAVEIADELGIGLPAATQRIRRGRMMLTTAVADGHDRRRAMEGVPMRCWDARHLVSGYLDDALTADERAGVEAHLVECPTCPPLYASLVGARDALRARASMRDRNDVVPPELAGRIQRLLAGHSGV
jgi:RNA polymerase sigma-70 factor (ECF subfamily)